MKRIKYNPVIFKILLAFAVLGACMSQEGYCQYDEEQRYSLFVEASPINTGFVTPEPGVHKAIFNETVVLKAIAKPGYRFVYWLGDVADPIANETTVTLDSPKIVIAVFEREEFSLLSPSVVPQKSRGSGGGAASANRFSPNNSMSTPAPIRAIPRPFIFPDLTQSPLPVPEDPLAFPVPGPGDGDDGDEVVFPVPGEEIPEPATIALFGFGASIVLKRKRSV